MWVALLNLENAYGSPPEEAALAAFRRAAAHTDPKKLHLAAAGIFERSARPEAARTLLKAACRKFGGSAKVGRALAIAPGRCLPAFKSHSCLASSRRSCSSLSQCSLL